MKLYGWIPHLGPDLNTEIPGAMERVPHEDVIHCDDIEFLREMHIQLDVPDGYRFGKTPIRCSVEYGNLHNEATVVVDTDGLMSLESSSEQYGEVMTRRVLREIYFLFKRSLHVDTHHIPDYRGEDSLDGPDELLTISHSEDRIEALSEISAFFIRAIGDMNGDVGRLVSRGQDAFGDRYRGFLIHDQYRTAMGYTVYAENFASLFFPSDQKYSTALEVFRDSLTDLYNVYCNNIVHRLNLSLLRTVKLMETQSEESSKITKWMLVIAVSTLITGIVSIMSVLCRRTNDRTESSKIFTSQ